MTENDAVVRLGSLLASVRYPHPEADSERRAGAALPFVTLSRQTGAGGITFCECLLQVLNANPAVGQQRWMAVDGQMADKVVEEHALPPELAEKMAEESHPLLQEWIEELIGNNPSWSALVHKTNQTILHLAQKGHVVLVGRGANLVTRRLPGGVHIHLVGSLERRVAHARDYYRLSDGDARERLHRDGKGQTEYVKQYFGEDIDDASLYDVTICTDRVPVDVAALLVGDLVQQARCRLAG